MRWLAPLGGLGLVVACAAVPEESLAGSPVVVEFYTSQGCSSCPPADAIFSDLVKMPGVIGLALHVDYWDYLGWEDPYGKEEHTERQRSYAKANKERTIYTPQMIVQGQDRLKGNEEGTIRDSIAAHAARPSAARVEVRRAAGGLEIDIAPQAGPVGPAQVHLVEFLPAETMTVESGENAGYEHTFANIVTDWSTIALWDGASPVTLHQKGEIGDSVAVLVQSPGMGPVLGAALLP